MISYQSQHPPIDAAWHIAGRHRKPMLYALVKAHVTDRCVSHGATGMKFTTYCQPVDFRRGVRAVFAGVSASCMSFGLFPVEPLGSATSSLDIACVYSSSLSYSRLLRFPGVYCWEAG